MDLGEEGFMAATEVQDFEDFDSMNLDDRLLRGIYAAGYESPSPIQRKAIVPCVSGRDVICQAQSGTGKTATFATAIIQRVDASLLATQALVLSPTRELADQTYDVVKALALYTDVSTYCCVGGTNTAKMAQELRQQRPHVVIATPGRCLDCLTRSHLDGADVRMLVLDEMDVLLNVGFHDTIHEIFVRLPSDVQVVLVSATMPSGALELSAKFMRHPLRIMVKQEAITLAGIRQYRIDLDAEEDKIVTLCDIFDAVSVGLCVIFVNSGDKAEWLAAALDRQNFTVGLIHGRLSTDQRNETVKLFRSGHKRVLVATDVLARGIDVQGVGCVINYDLPRDKENYIHRVGRCGRYGRKGFAVNFIIPSDQRFRTSIEVFYSTQIKELPADPADWLA